MAPENVRAASAAGSAERLRGKRHAAVGFDRMIEAWRSLPEPNQRAMTAIIHRRLAPGARIIEGGHPGDRDTAR